MILLTYKVVHFECSLSSSLSRLQMTFECSRATSRGIIPGLSPYSAPSYSSSIISRNTVPHHQNLLTIFPYPNPFALLHLDLNPSILHLSVIDKGILLQLILPTNNHHHQLTCLPTTHHPFLLPSPAIEARIHTSGKERRNDIKGENKVLQEPLSLIRSSLLQRFLRSFGFGFEVLFREPDSLELVFQLTG